MGKRDDPMLPGLWLKDEVGKLGGCYLVLFWAIGFDAPMEGHQVGIRNGEL